MMKKIFVTVSTWLRSIVATMMREEGRGKSEEVKDTRSMYDNGDVNINVIVIVGSASALPKPTDL